MGWTAGHGSSNTEGRVTNMRDTEATSRVAAATPVNDAATDADFVPVFKPLIEDGEIEAAVQSLQTGWLGMGVSVGQFEDALGAFLELKDRHVVAVNTGHSALHLALMLIGCGPGDEIITPSFNNIADFQAILRQAQHPSCVIFVTTRFASTSRKRKR